MTVPADTGKDRSALLRDVAASAGERQRGLEIRKQATEDLRERALRAQQAGATVTEIASVAGLSRQGLYDLLGDRRPS